MQSNLASTENCEIIPKGYRAQHVCMFHRLTYNRTLPTFGSHRPLWPVYGEYQFLPLQRWLHSLEVWSFVLWMSTVLQNCHSMQCPAMFQFLVLSFMSHRFLPDLSLQHGGIVMLYHPCAEPVLVRRLRKLLTGCFRKHIITPYTLLTQERVCLLQWKRCHYHDDYHYCAGKNSFSVWLIFIEL